mmetsp:Transcript_13143/g.27145  ORF Transcript_13143/g.27145 Transcript_13143/m.27145 type:complete len:132 (+) Transcript_13143:33-428(+)
MAACTMAPNLPSNFLFDLVKSSDQKVEIVEHYQIVSEKFKILMIIQLNRKNVPLRSYELCGRALSTYIIPYLYFFPSFFHVPFCIVVSLANFVLYCQIYLLFYSLLTFYFCLFVLFVPCLPLDLKSFQTQF